MNASTEFPDALFDSNTLLEKPKARSPLEWLATPSQKAGLGRLNEMGDVFFRTGNRQHAGFRPLTCSLMVGESGSGKSRLAREFAKQRDYPYLPVDCGSWNPQGSFSRPQTLTIIRDHIRANRGRPCVVYLDEVDKLLPANAESSASSWVLGCWGEFLALADGCARLKTHDWKEQDIQGLEACLLLAGGAFTAAHKDARRCSKQGGLGFQSSGPALVSHADKIREQLPVEVYSRFHRTLIVLEPPTRDDYAMAIDLIHFELSIPWPRPIKEILDEAECSGAGMRWIESYLADLLVAHPDLLKPKEENEARPVKRHQYDFFTQDTHHYARQVTEYSFELRGLLGRLSAELIARQEQISRSRNTAFKDFLYGSDGQRFLFLAENARRHSNACQDISDDDSEVTAALVPWVEEAWIAMNRFPAELTRYGLMPMFSRTWDLAFRVSELRTRISTGVAMGRYGHQP